MNNTFDNLWVFKNQNEHDRAHKYDARRLGKRASYQGFDDYDESGCLLFFLIAITIISSLVIII